MLNAPVCGGGGSLRARPWFALGCIALHEDSQEMLGSNVVMSQSGQVRHLSQCQEGSNLPFSFVLGTLFFCQPYLPIVYCI